MGRWELEEPYQRQEGIPEHLEYALGSRSSSFVGRYQEEQRESGNIFVEVSFLSVGTQKIVSMITALVRICTAFFFLISPSEIFSRSQNIWHFSLTQSTTTVQQHSLAKFTRTRSFCQSTI